MSHQDHGRHRTFSRSFDTASQQTEESHETGPSLRSRRTAVPFVNERREFDPRYDPRNPDTFVFYHKPRQEKPNEDARAYGNLKHPANAQDAHSKAPQNQFYEGATNNRNSLHSSGPNNTCIRMASHAVQRRQQHQEAQSAQGNLIGRGAFFHPEEDSRLDRPFDESTNSYRGSTADDPFDESANSYRGSAAELDSLDEMLDQDSFTTTTETTGEDRFENVLSAIEEHPSLEGGSFSYSFTQLNSTMFPSMKSTDSSDDKESDARSRSPLDPNVFRNPESFLGMAKPPQPSTRSILISPETKTYTQQSDRSPLVQGMSVWETATTPRSADYGTSSRSTAMTTPETPSIASSSLSPSEAAQKEAKKLIQNFDSSPRKKEPTSKSSNEQSTNPLFMAASASTTEDTNTLNSEEQDLMLHDLCGESSSTDDVAWRNALHVLAIQPHLASVLDSAGWTPLHVACLGSTPPPLFMTRSLLYVYRGAAHKVDSGGRLPLHLVAASSGDAETMQLLIQEYPQAVYQTDYQGWTPLHLILKNFSVDIHLNHCRVLLGLDSLDALDEKEAKSQNILQRRGEHLSLQLEDLDRVVRKTTPVTRMAQENIHEEAFKAFPRDVQASLRRLCQWKRKQRRHNNHSGSEDTGTLELDVDLSLDAETNPAAHFTPVKRQLPIHTIVRRGLSESTHKLGYDFQEEGGAGEDTEEPTSTSIAPRFLELVRLFIAVYPEGLVARDHHGHTPLLAALSMNNAQPSLELVELLLGKRTPGYNSLPSWAHNMPLYNLSADRYLNPAMVPCKKSHQLPLHIVAEEQADNFSMLSSIHGCYPGAIQCQDSRGRTPLHLLLRNYRRSPVDPSTVALLLSDDVAQTIDGEGKLPFDLLAENARSIPLEHSHSQHNNGPSEDDIRTFKKFFQGAIVASSESNLRNRLGSDSFLWRLRSLPPWLRRQACSATFVQELLIEELASPAKCALILLYALLLCTLIVVFRIEVQDFIQNPEGTIPAWVLLGVYTSTSGLLLFQLIFWSLCMSMSEFLHLCVFNIWRWVDLSAILLVGISTTMMNYLPASNEAVLATSTAATGMLWLSTVGFFSSWWYGAAIFTASVQKIASLMVWPVVVASILVASFSQMFYTIANINCNQALSEVGVCSLRESYMLVYYLIIGEPIVDFENDTRIASSITTLAVLFLTALFLLALSIVSMVIIVGSDYDFEDLALTSFWEPKITFATFACGRDSASCKSKAPSVLESTWNVATQVLSYRDSAKGTYWYACYTGKPGFVKLCYWLVAALLVPIWIVAGLFTFGLLWPPQVRRCLFRPRLGNPNKPRRDKMSSAEFYASQVSGMRRELMQIRDMSYERSNDVRRDLRELKDILHLATAE